MDTNPYESPKQGIIGKANNTKKFAWYSIGWVVCLVIPALAATIATWLFPLAAIDPLFADTHFFRALSRAFRVPADAILLISLVGCSICIIKLPVDLPWKGAAVVWKVVLVSTWFPLATLQVFVILFALVAAGYLSA